MNTTDYFVLCETTTQDKKGRVSLINIFDSIGADELPVNPGKISVAFSFEITPEKLSKPFDLTVEIDAPDGSNLFRAKGQVSTNKNMQMPKEAAARIISALDINSPTFKEFGEYKYRLKIDDQVLNENCLRILKNKSIKEVKAKGK